MSRSIDAPVAAVGVLNLDKPAGLTSAAVVGRLKRSTGIKRVGHGGTLDPQATGVLPIFFGRATSLAEILSRQGKTYRAEIRLGAGSDTDDAEGHLESAAVPTTVDGAAVRAALQGFLGDIEQRPPTYSAVKIQGVRSYRRARGGEDVAPLAAREVRVEAIRLVDFGDASAGTPGPLLVVEVTSGPGFYVRALARDLGEALGTRAHLEALVRTRVGPLEVAAAMSLPDAEAMGPGLAAVLRPPSVALAGWARVAVGAAGAGALRHGQDIPAPLLPMGRAYATDPDGRVLAIGTVTAGVFHPKRLVEL